MKTILDSDLRERFSDADAGRRKLQHAREQLEAWREEARDGDPVSRSNVGRWLQRVSEYLRLSGDLEASLVAKDETLLVWEELARPRAHFLVRLQRALVRAELDPDTAAGDFEALFDEMAGDEDLEPFYLGFWLEYEARRLFWAGDFDAAIKHLQQAIEFRREHRAARIVERTEAALDMVRNAAEKV